MINAANLKDRRLAAKAAKDADLAETERLKARLARARDKRVPFYLTREEFLEICHWQLGDKFARAARLLESSSERRIKRITRLAFAVKDKDADFELGARLAILRLLPGVGIGVASAILALCNPKKLAPLDARAWQAVFDDKRGASEVADYQRYLTRLGELESEVRSLDPKGRWSPLLVAYYTAGRSDARPARQG